jgi:PAS domain S-box-containing protein
VPDLAVSIALVVLLAGLTAAVLLHAVRARRAAERAEERLQAVIDATPLGLTLVDPGGLVRLWNPGAEQIFGWTESEVLGRPLPTVPSHGWDVFLAELGRQMSGTALVATEQPAVRKDGSWVEVRVWTAPFRDERGRIVASLGIIADISESKRLEAELRQAQRLESVAKLAGGIAHDFNNLLTVIGAQYDLALRRLEPEHPVRGTLGEVRQAVRSASALTRQLLAFSRKQLLQTTIVDLNDVIGVVAGMLRSVLGEDVELVTRLDGSLPPVRADRGQLEQVLMNLAVNGREAMPEGGLLTIETRAVAASGDPLDRPSAAGEPAFAELTVTDTGEGMSDEVQMHAFDPFFTTKENGTGLGLATVHGVIQQSGGTISLETTPGVGTRVWILLPGASATAPVAEPAADHRPPDVCAPLEGRVLVVEDDDLLRRLAGELLEDAGFDVVTADNGEHALELFKEQEDRVDVLLTDLVMPRMSGRELAAHVRAIDESCQIVFMSGYDAGFDVEAEPTTYATGVLPKPFSADKLVAVVRAAVANGRAAIGS